MRDGKKQPARLHTTVASRCSYTPFTPPLCGELAGLKYDDILNEDFADVKLAVSRLPREEQIAR